MMEKFQPGGIEIELRPLELAPRFPVLTSMINT
jgi:hypothetical protein